MKVLLIIGIIGALALIGYYVWAIINAMRADKRVKVWLTKEKATIKKYEKQAVTEAEKIYEELRAETQDLARKLGMELDDYRKSLTSKQVEVTVEPVAKVSYIPVDIKLVTTESTKVNSVTTEKTDET